MTQITATARLQALAAQVRDDLARTAHPAGRWVPPRVAAEASPIHDVVIAGAGQGGLAIAPALRRERVENILVIDRAKYGCEGERALGALSLSFAGGEFRRERAGERAVPERHPRLHDRYNDALQAVRLLDQRHEHCGAETGGGDAGRPARDSTLRTRGRGGTAADAFEQHAHLLKGVRAGRAAGGIRAHADGSW